MTRDIGELTSAEWHALRPYLAERRARNGKNGAEWALHCPLHEDERPSAELNPVRRQWYCNRGCGGGSVNELMDRRSEWTLPPHGAGLDEPPPVVAVKGEPLPTRNQVRYWNERLLKRCKPELDWLKTQRGLALSTIQKNMVGYNEYLSCYTIPVFGMRTSEILDVRYYYPDPKPGMSKIRSVAGHGGARLYPAQWLRRAKPGDTVLFGEGEWDCLLTRQNMPGLKMFVVTASAGSWVPEWGEHFRDTHAIICLDCDDHGRDKAPVLAEALRPYAASVSVLSLPYPHSEKDGKDLTDYWLDRRGRRDRGRVEFRKLLERTEDKMRNRPVQGTIADARDRRRAGQLMQVGSLRLYSEKEPYSVPHRVELSCKFTGDQCAKCPREVVVHDEFTLGDPRLSMFPMQDTDVQRKEVVTLLLGTNRPCPHARVKILDDHAARMLWLYDSTNTDSMIQVMLFDDGKVTIPPQTELDMVGCPGKLERHKSVNMFLASSLLPSKQHPWGVAGKLPLRRFRDKTVSPLEQCDQLAAANEVVSDVYGHRDMQIFMDLILHSVSGFMRRDKLVSGVLDAIILGADRTGKTQMAKNMLEFYGVGELMQGETLSVAGLVGGSEKTSGERYVATPGALPRNHEGVLVLDEIQKAHRDVRDSLSSARGSRLVNIGKMGHRKFGSNTRLLMIANPVEGREDQPMFRSLAQIFTRRPDIARFDMAMGVSDIDVERAMYEATRSEVKAPSREWATELLWWCWTRKPEQVILPHSAMVRKQAARMKRRYPFTDTRLVDPGSVDVKILRVACAMAARTFSTDPTRTKVLVTDQHVTDAAEFMMSLYDDPVFGLGTESGRRMRRAAQEQADIAWFIDKIRGTADCRRLAEWLCDPDAWPLDVGSHTKLLEDRHKVVGELVRRRLLAPHTSNSRNVYPVPALIAALIKEGLAE